MVAEDIPADQVGNRLTEWGAMIQPAQYQTRIASLIGVKPASDNGQPAQLALSNFPTVPQMAAETTEDPFYSEGNDTGSFAMASELPAIGAPSATADEGDAAFADAGLQPVAQPRAASAPAPAPQPAPVRTAQAPNAAGDASPKFASAFSGTAAPSAAAPAPRKPAKAAPRSAPARSSAAAPATRSSLASGDYNVQLGSYYSMSDAQAAWKRFQARYPDLADAERVITKARVNGKIYYRVAAAGFARSSANQICSTVKGKGGGCLAYASTRPLPGHLGDAAIRVASR